MNFLISLLGACFGIILAIVIIVIIIYLKIRKEVGGSNMKILTNAARQAASNPQEFSGEIKNVSGMTSIYEPRILEDFPDFNKELLFNKIETCLNAIFNSLENKQISSNDELELLSNFLQEKIDDLNSTNTNIRYDNIKFHRHAIKGYTKADRVATITTSSTLEYNYINDKDNKYKDVKKQTRYTCKFVYVYNTNTLKSANNSKLDKKVFILNCPNCGAPLNNLINNRCEYCGIGINEINLKIWKICSYSEDYK